MENPAVSPTTVTSLIVNPSESGSRPPNVVNVGFLVVVFVGDIGDWNAVGHCAGRCIGFVVGKLRHVTHYL